MSESNFISALANLCLQEKFADVTFVCKDGVRIKAHKVILALRSEYFATLLFENKVGDQVSTATCNGRVLEIIMKHIYGQDLSLYQENILTLMEALDNTKEMGLDDLEQLLEEALCDNFLVDDFEHECVENVIEILNEAVKRNRDTLIVDAFNFISGMIEIFAASSSFKDLSQQSVLALMRASELRSGAETQHFNTHFHNAVIKWLFHDNSLENNVKQSILNKLDMEFIYTENLVDLMQMKILDSVEQILEENVEEIEGLRCEIENLRAQLQKRDENSDKFLIISKLKKFVNEIIINATNAHFLPQILASSTTRDTVCMISSRVMDNLINHRCRPIVDVIIPPVHQVLNYLNILSSREINNNNQKEVGRNKNE